jgi:glycosyltransferase involved in cell wall biosynthesis
MKVGIDIQSTKGRKTGIGYYAGSLITEFNKIKDIDIISLCSSDFSDMNTPRRVFWENFQMPAMASKHDLDVLHVPGFAGPRRRCMHKKITTVCDLIGMIYPENLAPVSRFYWQKWLPACIKNSDALIAISEHTKRDIVRILGIPENKIYVTLLAADPVFRPIYDTEKLEAISQKYRLPENFMLALGTIEPRKNMPRLIEAFANYVNKTDTDLFLVMVGKQDWGYDKVVEIIKKRQIAERIKFTGYIDEDDMPGIYNLAKFFSYPSLYEGFGLPVLEAMACARPVICSNSSSLPEVAQDAAILVDPLDVKEMEMAIEKFDTDDRAREDFSARATLQAAKFSWKKTAIKTIDVYKEVLGG